MRMFWFLLLFLLLTQPVLATHGTPAGQTQPVELEFGGYRFGQSPAANMICQSGFCKSQAPGGDGRVSFPFSMYETPGAVSTQVGMTIVNVRYNFWEDYLYRIVFRVDCAPQATEECIDDLIKSLDREYGLTPLSTSDTQHFITGKRSILREFVTESGALVRIRAASNQGEWHMPNVDIVDKGVADRVGSTLSPSYKAKKLILPGTLEKQ